MYSTPKSEDISMNKIEGTWLLVHNSTASKHLIYSVQLAYFDIWLCSSTNREGRPGRLGAEKIGCEEVTILSSSVEAIGFSIQRWHYVEK